MILPKWYKSKFSIQALQLSEENFEDVKKWIDRESSYRTMSYRKDRIVIFKGEMNKYVEKRLYLGEWAAIDAIREIYIFDNSQFQHIYYEASYRTVQDYDIL